jgi:HSP20 family protein
MFLTRWNRPEAPSFSTFDRLTSLRDEIDRLFEMPLAELGRSSQLFGGWSPAVDLYEGKDNFVVKAELPGLKRQEISISIDQGALHIAGERKRTEKAENSTSYREERFYGKFYRSIVLPKPVAADKVKASYKDGVLTVTLPKTEEAKPKHIEVNIN